MDNKSTVYWAKSFGISERSFFRKLKSGEIEKLEFGGYEKSANYIEPKRIGNRAKKSPAIEYIQIPDHPVINNAPIDGDTVWQDDKDMYAIAWQNADAGFSFLDKLMFGVLDTMYRIQASEDRLANQEEKESVQVSFEAIARIFTGKNGRVKIDVVRDMITKFVERVKQLQNHKVMFVQIDKKSEKEKAVEFDAGDYVISGNFITIKQSPFSKISLPKIKISTSYFFHGKNTEKNILTKANFSYRKAKIESIKKARGDSNEWISIDTMSNDIGYSVDFKWMRNYLRELVKRGIIPGYDIRNSSYKITDKMSEKILAEDAIAEAKKEARAKIETIDENEKEIKNGLEQSQNTVLQIVAKLKDAEDAENTENTENTEGNTMPIIELGADIEDIADIEIFKKQEANMGAKRILKIAEVRSDFFKALTKIIEEKKEKEVAESESEEKAEEKAEEKEDKQLASKLAQWRSRVAI